MKLGQFFKKMVGGSMILATLACPVFTSCYDDTGLIQRVEDIEGEITDIKEKLAALEAKLNTDLEALKTLLGNRIGALEDKVDGLVTVKDVKTNSNGSVVITLSNGKSFTVNPAQDNSGLVTTLEMEGKLYWAIFDEKGQPKLVTDADGNPIPVVDVLPQVKVDPETALVMISFDGGNEWIEVGYNQPCVFSDAEVVYTDNYTDEQEANDPDWCYETPMYVVLTLADGNTITVSIDGAASFMFGSNYGGIIRNQYISAGNTTAISVLASNIAEWIKEVPAGWQIVEDTQYLADYGQAEFHVTAPSAEAIASGAAVAEGTLKVLAVAEGGKSVTASIFLTTNPFKTVAAGKGNLTVNMNSGVGGYLVGVSTVADFNADAIKAELKAVVEAWEEDWFGDLAPSWSPWYTEDNSTPLDDNYFDASVEDYPLASLSNIPELVAGEQYVVWVVALDSWVDNATRMSGYNVGTLFAAPYFHGFINMNEEVVKFNSINISAEFVGIEAYYGQFQMLYSDELNKEGILAEFNSSLGSAYGSPQLMMVNDEYVEGWNNGVFTGNPNDLVNGWQKIMPDETYYLMIVPYVEGKTSYSLADVYFYEWTTEAIIAGGTVNVTAGDPTLEYKKISVPVTAEGAVYIYYKWLDPAMVSTIADKAAYLLENGAMEAGTSATLSQANLTPGQTKTLLALAVDQYGCYGEVFQKDYTSKLMEYAAATVTAELQGIPAQTGNVKFSCTADVDTYYYWYGEATAYNWTSEYYFGGSAETASAFIALTPDSYLLKKVTPANLPEGGVEMTGLTVGAKSLICVAAKLTDGTFTKATVVTFTPEMDLGNFVFAQDDNGNENPKWTAAKPKVSANVETIGDFNIVSWSVELPEGYTAITSCFSKDFLMDYPSPKSKVQFLLTYEYIERFDVVKGEIYSYPYASKGYNIYTLVKDAEGNYYEVYVHELDITGGFGV